MRHWQTLVARAVDDCDAAWVPGADAALLTALRASPTGRRLLARCLANGVAPALMNVPAIDVLATLPQCDWVLDRGEQLRSRIADLGCLALAPGVRKLVDRNAVRSLRTALGGKRYDWLLGSGAELDGQMSEVRRLKGWRLVDQFMGDEDAFVRLIIERGLDEIGGALTGAPVLLRERVRLLFPPSDTGNTADPWLPPGRALRLMREGGSDAQALNPALRGLPQQAATAEAV
ncbi:MAG: hypothetical protein AB8G17_05605 [Gammaproteobacteria bacterium]